MTPEQRAARLHYHLYDSLEGIEQQSERIVALEELVMDYDKMLAITTHEDADLILMPSVLLSLRSRAYGLGIEVDA